MLLEHVGCNRFTSLYSDRLLDQLERSRRSVLRAVSQLGDLRPGSITGIVRRCGKPTCHCTHPGDAGHGPNFRLTYRVDGKTISEALPNPRLVRKAAREIAEFRRFQELSRSLVQVNQRICRLRSEEVTLSAQENKTAGAIIKALAENN